MMYPAALSYLNSFINYEWFDSYPYKSSFRLDTVQRLLRLLGNPQQGLRPIHIAGTKGKGSTCAFVANILREAHFKVGIYTSPHLLDVRERIRILQPAPRHKRSGPGKPARPAAEAKRAGEKGIISQKDFARQIEKIRPHAERLRKTRLGELSYFEILTALAFLYFKEKKTDFVVLETGMGGRLDATNVVSSLVSAITPISYEHTDVLGATLEKITEEKAGIIKVSTFPIVVTAPQRPAALKVISRRVKRVGADLCEVGKDIQIRERSSGKGGQSFTVRGILNEYPDLKIGLLGRHQIINAAVAIGCVEALRCRGVKVAPEALRKGLKKTRWPGRLQVISHRPLLVLDAAHNRASASALKEAIGESFKFGRLILVFGVCRDKDVRGILRELLPLASKIIFTKTQNPRAMAPETIKTFIKTNERPVSLTDNVTEAVKTARREARRQDLILVCGSLYLLGEALRNKNYPKHLWGMAAPRDPRNEDDAKVQ